jgi:hypothetical protein
MSYIRNGHPLHWFNSNSTEYVFGCSKNQIEDYGSGFEHLPSLVEMIGNIIIAETGDFVFATKIVCNLANNLNIADKLRKTPHPNAIMEKTQNRDYLKEIERWNTFFSDYKPLETDDEGN